MDLVFYAIGGAIVLLFVLYVMYRRRRASGASIVRFDNPGIQYLEGRDAVSIRSVRGQKMSSAQHRRRRSHIHAYVGLNGSGKSATMMWDTMQDLADGKTVLSTMAILSPVKADNPLDAEKAWMAIGMDHLRPRDELLLPHPQWVPLIDWLQVINARNCVILLDEVQGVADGRQSQGLPTQVATFLYKLRAKGVVVRWTTIDYSVPDKRIRDVTRAVTYCKGYYPNYAGNSMWGRNRIFWLRTYKADEFENFTQARNRVNDKHRIKPYIRQWVRGAGQLQVAFDAYNSGGEVLTLGVHNDAGMCVTCGGRRTVPQCSCPDHVAKKKKPRTETPALPKGEDVAVIGGFGLAEGQDITLPDVADSTVILSRVERRKREKAEAACAC